MGQHRIDVGDPFPLEALPHRGAELHGPAVVYFYKAANTPSCTRQAVEFDRHYEAFREAGLEVLGVSVDPAEEQACMVDDQHLRFPMVADPDRTLTTRLGIVTTVPGHPEVGEVADRVTYLIGSDGTILGVWQVEDLTAHPVEVLETASRLGVAGSAAEPAQELPS